MVGVPRSNGCHLCIKRKIKCDQSLPGCGNCARYGAECPGYDKTFKFVAGKHHVRRRRRQAGLSTSPDDGVVVETPSSDDPSLVLSSRSSSAPIAERGTTTALTISPRESRGQFVCALLQNDEITGPANGLAIFVPWFTRASERLGSNVALDTAMSAFVLHLLGKAKEEDNMVHMSRSIYGQSLGLLQRALNHPVQWNSSETLCATMMLCFFELFAGTTDTGAWMKHASGVSWLIQQRGPSSYDNAWDRAIMFSFRALIIMNSMFSFQDCFLARNKWQKVLRPENTSGTVRTENEILHDEYLLVLAKVPGILRYGVGLREAKRHNMPIDATQVALLSQQAETLRTRFVSWFERYAKLQPGPTEVPSLDPRSIYETVLSYSNAWVGGIYMGYWASLLICQETLNQCQYPVDYAKSNQELVRNILRSVEVVAADLMGPYRVGYAIRIAYDFADVRAQAWITSLLATFEKRYAATSPTSYPKPTPNEYQYS